MRPAQLLRSTRVLQNFSFASNLPQASQSPLNTIARQRTIQSRSYSQPAHRFSPLLRRLRAFRRPYSTPKPSNGTPPTQLNSPEPSSLSARLKKLSREYGWSALGVYFALSALDFPFCFAAVRIIGPEKVGHAEHVVVSAFWRAVEWVVPDWIDRGKAVGEDETGVIQEGGAGWGVEQAQAANAKEDASIWTQLALAYAIHKTFIFVRVPLTAAVTPKVVKTLRGWGWDIGKRTKSSKLSSK